MHTHIVHFYVILGSCKFTGIQSRGIYTTKLRALCAFNGKSFGPETASLWSYKTDTLPIWKIIKTFFHPKIIVLV